MQSNQIGFSSEQYRAIHNLLLSDDKFKTDFSNDPLKAVLGAGIKLQPIEIEMLLNLRKRRELVEMETFDDRLILCSSAGF